MRCWTLKNYLSSGASLYPLTALALAACGGSPPAHPLVYGRAQDTPDPLPPAPTEGDGPVLEVNGAQTALNEGTVVADTPTGYTFTATGEDGGDVTLSVDDDRFVFPMSADCR